jgi:hypothetical protein
MGYDRRGILSSLPLQRKCCHEKGPHEVGWEGIQAGQIRDDGSIKGTAKEADIKMRRQRARRRDAAAERAWAEVEAARYARLPWPIRAVGVILDIVFRRPSP